MKKFVYRTILPFAAVVAGFIIYVSYRTRKVPTPHRPWKRFREPGTEDLDLASGQQLEGIYMVDQGSDFFGEIAMLKWSYTVDNKKTNYHLSIFCEKDGLYLICQGRRKDNQVLLHGYWRKSSSNGTGTVQLLLNSEENSGHDPFAGGHFSLHGKYGHGDDEPAQPVSFSYQEALPKKRPFEIIAHRGGARNVDFLPLSENSLEMMKMAAKLGATGVEIDVRLTKDKVPVLLHDSFLSVHTFKGPLYRGLVHNYTLKELKALELRKGGKVPTLRECLHTILYETPLETVWLDIKKECDLNDICQLQQEFSNKAQAIDRKLRIYIGVPDKKILGCFTQIENHKQIPSLTELEPAVAASLNAQVWAPQYTKGFQQEEVEKMHQAGRKVFVWSLDNKALIDVYMEEGGFDGLVTNTPSVVAHWYNLSSYRSKSHPVKQPEKQA